MEKRQMICVLCGQEWGAKFPFTNICENEKCKGVCTWGYELGKPLSWNIDDGQWKEKTLLLFAAYMENEMGINIPMSIINNYLENN